MPLIRLECVTKLFPGRGGCGVRALRDVSLEVEEGEWLAVLGPSGSGKTTFLRLVAGLDEPSAGRVWFSERASGEGGEGFGGMGMVFQGGALFPHLDALENLALPLRVRGVARARIEERVREMADWLGLGPLLTRRPGELSGGERQRVALGRALMRRPTALLLDEPLAGLDAPQRRQWRRDMRRMQDRLGLTVVHVTHDQEEALGMASRVAVLRQGELQQAASPEVIYDRPANLFVAGFVGHPPMNLIEGALRQEEEGLVFVTGAGGLGTLNARVPEGLIGRLGRGVGTGLVLGMRPQDLELAEATGRWLRPGMRAEVESVEAQPGGGAWLGLRLGMHLLSARVGAGLDLRVGDGVLVRLPLERAHWFDRETGVALVP